MSSQYEKLIPIPLLIATAIVAYMAFSGGIPMLGIGNEVQNEVLTINAVGDLAPLLPNAPMFKCPSCQNVLNIKKNEKSRKAYSKKIDEIKKDMQQTF